MPDTGTALKTPFNISITGAIDENLPITYAFYYYRKKDQLLAEIKSG
jgi:hypothetical protein